MKSFGFDWPENLECSRFSDSELCVGGDVTSGSVSDPPVRPALNPSTFNESYWKTGSFDAPVHAGRPRGVCHLK